MKKNTRYILITLAAAVVLGGAVTALLLTKPQAEDSSSSSSSTASSTTESISLFSYEDSEVASIQVKNTNDTFTIHAKTETSSASSEDEEDTTTTSFYLDGVDEKIQNSTASTLAIYGYSLSASNEIGDAEELKLEDYGLKEPQATVTTTLTDGEQETYSIGNEGPISGYYVQYDGKVYVASVNTGLFGTKLDFINTTVLTITPPSDENSESSSSEEATNEFTLFTFSGTNFPQEVKVVPQPDSLLSSYKLTSPYTVDANSSTFTSITEGVAALTATEAVAINPTDEELEEYGLKDPAVEMNFTVNGTSYTLLSGKLSGNTRYGMLKGVDVIYAFDESTVKDWSNATLFSLRDTFVSLEMISDVSKLTVETPDKKDVFTLIRTENEESSTEDKIAYDYSVTGTDGQEITYQDIFTKYYQSIIGVQLLEETTEETAQGEPMLTVTYEYYESEPNRVVKFYSIGDRRCLAEVDGQVIGVVTSQSVQNIIDNTEIVLQNKSVEGDTEE